MHGGRISLFNNIIGTTHSKLDYEWKKEEIENLIKKIVEWWDTDKEYLLRKEQGLPDSIRDEFISRFKYITKVFNSVIRSYTDLLTNDDWFQIRRIISEMEEYELPSLEAKACLITQFNDVEEELIKNILNSLNSRNSPEILNAMNAISILSENKRCDISCLINVVSQNIRIRTDIELDRFINCITIVLRNNKNLLTDEIMLNLDIALSNLLKESQIEKEDSEKDVHTKLLIRRSIANLIVVLSRIITSKEYPVFLKDWKKILQSEEEFSDIRNIVINGYDYTLL